jgi:hypothetical protein
MVVDGEEEGFSVVGMLVLVDACCVSKGTSSTPIFLLME